MNNCVIATFTVSYDYDGHNWKRVAFDNGEIVDSVVGDMGMDIFDIRNEIMRRIQPFVEQVADWVDWGKWKTEKHKHIKGIITAKDGIKRFVKEGCPETHVASVFRWQRTGKDANDKVFHLNIRRYYFYEKESRLHKAA